MKRFKVWYQLPMYERDGCFFYPPAHSAAFIYAPNLKLARVMVGFVIEEDRNRLEEAGFILHKIEEETDRMFEHVVKEIVEDTNDA